MSDQRILRELITYIPVTGEFFNRRWKPIGHVQPSNGRRYIYYNGRKVIATRLAYMWMKGHWPPFNLTHRNGIRDDVRWINLKPVSDARVFKMVKYEAEGQYIAQICVYGKLHFLGYFNDPKDGHAAVRRALKPANFYQYLPKRIQRKELNRPRFG